ncbi:ferrous iron transport protein B [Alkalibaculum bacchi]|uniref:ferrous iron transport protein B n=1 Tax=Alkalibaculum bacchi TaxID=645887 RepID=UPI0026F1382D|nr:ferrous iron transport protein B [Alkalibaculum bacchi]
MGLTYQSSKREAFVDLFDIQKEDGEYAIALAGNPNTGKSTVFNALTGLHQHTGNWPGKTVVNARGNFNYKGQDYILVDLPGTYSLFASSEEEIVARDYICFGNPDAVIVVADATCLERNLNLLLQVMELSDKVVLCINLIDEAKKKGIHIDVEGLKKELSIPIVLTSAREGIGLDQLQKEISSLVRTSVQSSNKKTYYSDDIEEKVEQIESQLEVLPLNKRWLSLRILDSDLFFIESLKEYIPEESYKNIEAIWKSIHIDKGATREFINNHNFKYIEFLVDKYVKSSKNIHERDMKIDNIITSKKYGIPIMILCLGIVFWITIVGSNYPSQALSKILFGFQNHLSAFLISINVSSWLRNLLLDGVYKTTAWVVSVMLPPMAIFFPLFTILEDLGFLPRVAFNLDHLFKKASAHGKQCLTMCMGFGCNAAGVIGCRIIESPRERVIAIITNNFVPCNGRFPTLIAISVMFFTLSSGEGIINSLITTLSLTAIILLGIIITLLVSYVLSKTLLKGVPSTFTLELPPYRIPKIGRVLYSSLIDRTIFVLKRALLVAIPTGAAIWILANISIGNVPILQILSGILDPLGQLIGLDGVILLAFILGMPANEIVLPIILMAYLNAGSLMDYESLSSLRDIFLANNWTLLTALNTMLFSLLHWPCSSTLWTIKKETGSLKWTVLAFMIPTVIAFGVCFITASVYRLLF